MKKIDVFSHILTPEFSKRFLSLAPDAAKTVEFMRPAMVDLKIRKKFMSRFPDVLQIVTMGNVPLDRYVSAKEATELAKIGNDEMAELVRNEPDMFYGAVGTIPVDDVDASLEIIEHCVNKLGLLGIQLFATIEREPYSEQKYRPIFALMAKLGRPIWIHPAGTLNDWERAVFTWPYESSRFMLDVVRAGIFTDYPNLKIIIHHAGAMVPHYQGRIKYSMPLEYQEHFRCFYTDTALYGNTQGLMGTFEYFGAEHMMFGTDAPLGGPLFGSNGATDNTILAIEKMSISDEDKEKIFRNNAIKMFGTPV